MNHKKSGKKSPVSAICSALGTALLVVLIIVCIPFTVPKLFHYEIYTVVSGSMEPSIPIGSLVYVKEVEPETIVKDDVIAFWGGRESNVHVTHRVVKNDAEAEQFITKGDANQTEDMNPVDYDDYVGKVVLSIPKLGALAQSLTGMAGKMCAAVLIGLAVLLNLAASVFERH